MVCFSDYPFVSPKIAELIATTSYDQNGLRELVAVLPADDAELHRWLTGAAAAKPVRISALLGLPASASGFSESGQRITIIEPYVGV